MDRVNSRMGGGSTYSKYTDSSVIKRVVDSDDEEDGNYLKRLDDPSEKGRQ